MSDFFARNTNMDIEKLKNIEITEFIRCLLLARLLIGLANL